MNYLSIRLHLEAAFTLFFIISCKDTTKRKFPELLQKATRIIGQACLKCVCVRGVIWKTLGNVSVTVTNSLHLIIHLYFYRNDIMHNMWLYVI